MLQSYHFHSFPPVEWCLAAQLSWSPSQLTGWRPAIMKWLCISEKANVSTPQGMWAWTPDPSPAGVAMLNSGPLTKLYYVCTCVYVCMLECVCVCVHASVCVCVCVCVLGSTDLTPPLSPPLALLLGSSAVENNM